MKKFKAFFTAIVCLTLFGATIEAKSVSVDMGGETVEFPTNPKNIITLDFGALDTLKALGAQKNVIGIPKSSLPKYLDEFNSLEDIGSIVAPDIDYVKSLKPELIIIGGRQGRVKDELSKVTQLLDLSGKGETYTLYKTNILNLAKIVDKDSEATKLLNELDKKVLNTKEAIQKSGKSALFVMSNNGTASVINSGSRADMLYDIAGFKRVMPLQDLKEGEKPKRVLVDSKLIEDLKPDIIFVLDRSAAINQGKKLDISFFDKNVLNKSNSKVVFLSADLWYLSGGGLQSISMQLDELLESIK